MKKMSFMILLMMLVTCGPPSPLTQKKAEEILDNGHFQAEPIYAEVPQKVWWGPSSPQDDYDRKALTTLHNLERAGLVAVTDTHDGANEIVQAKVTQKGFNILGTMPSMRGPVYRALIAQKKYDGLRNFMRHPNEPTVGRAELIWHYENPTWLYPLFETKINKPLNTPFQSIVVFYWKDHAWRTDLLVKKEQAPP
jgi:hypothetical protein